MKTLLGPWCGVLALSVLLVSGCGGSDSSAASNTIEINGTSYDIVDTTIWYYQDERWVQFDTADGRGIMFDFTGMGDPAVPANEIPAGSWTDMNATFDGVSVWEPGGNRTYDSSSTYSGSLRVSGTPSSTLSVEASYEFTSGDADTIRVSYSGPYTYSAD
jgi:hypothetical protein